MKKEINKLTHQEFCDLLNIDFENRFQIFLGNEEQDDFVIYEDTKTSKLFFLETGINDVSDFYEVEIVACLEYKEGDEKTDVEKARDSLSEVFDAIASNFKEENGKIKVYWFRKKED